MSLRDWSKCVEPDLPVDLRTLCPCTPDLPEDLRTLCTCTPDLPVDLRTLCTCTPNLPVDLRTLYACTVILSAVLAAVRFDDPVRDYGPLCRLCTWTAELTQGRAHRVCRNVGGVYSDSEGHRSGTQWRPDILVETYFSRTCESPGNCAQISRDSETVDVA